MGMVVDRLVSKREIVIKSPDCFIDSMPGLSGCMIVGDGRIALILDILGLTGACSQAQGQEIVK